MIYCGYEVVDFGVKFIDVNIEFLVLGSMGVLNCVGDLLFNIYDGWCVCV